MNTYKILKKTPTTRWHVIHQGFSASQAHDFLQEMAMGGYDRCADAGEYNPSTMTAWYEDKGDIVRYRADAEQ